MNTTSAMEPQPGYAVIYGCIIALGLPLNAVSLVVLLHRHSLKSSTVVFMINLIISDLLLIISLPMRVYFYATGTWPLSQMACTFVTMLFRDNIRSSCIFITFISMDRLVAVVYPLRSRHLRTLSKAWKAAAAIWLFLMLINIPETLLFSEHNEKTCFEFKTPGSGSRGFSYFQLVLMFTTLTVNIVCTALVSWTLHRMTDSARLKNKVNVMLLFAINLLMFIICFLPMTVALLTIVDRPRISPFICLASMNCCLDPLLYCFSLDAFWKKKEDVDHTRET
ncbi:Lysophosphatidic acid receptor 6 [Channa argus]|uniref:Lysophosphatidic acid receptor 6 n=2 Tax=Channa argus TaxID=215402 RepID=A0A6G1PS00_CHAAH|nr:Lysophosphatidic acid receptor 6 [Channa argus]